MFQRVLSSGAGVSQICWIAPGPVISARVKVDLAGTRTYGETFQPWPRSRAALLAGPSVDMPALPFSPVKFSGLMERVLAFESRGRLPRFRSSPLNGESAARAEMEMRRARDKVASLRFIGGRNDVKWVKRVKKVKWPFLIGRDD